MITRHNPEVDAAEIAADKRMITATQANLEATAKQLAKGRATLSRSAELLAVSNKLVDHMPECGQAGHKSQPDR